jgi:hypothetical protein
VTDPAVWEPQPGPQALAISARFCTEILYGGARGGGKSSYLLGDYLQDVEQGPGWAGILFRKSYPELEELVKQAKEMYIPLGATWKVSERTFTFPTGATLKMRHVDNEDDAMLYQGHEYAWIGWDEIGNWPNLNSYKKLKACLRGTDKAVTHKRIRATANPGGPGHHSVKNYFIDHHPAGFEMVTTEEGTTRMFIPAKVTDNKILLSVDPGYVSRLREVGSPELVKAWLEGDWNVITGAYFPEFSTLEHIIAPFAIPKHWMRFMSGDWGSASPFSFHWHAVSDGTISVPDLRPPDPLSFDTVRRYPRTIPKGAIVTYREWYGAVAGMVNTGLRWPASRVAQGIIARTPTDEKITYRVLDPSAFKQDGGPSHAEVMARAGVFFRPADNTRLAGWGAIRERLTGIDADPDVNNGVGTPMLYIFNTCPHLIRTLPALQHDTKDPEDCDTTAEDHAPDDLRYGCMSRPWSRPKPKPVREQPKSLETVTLGDLFTDRQNSLAINQYGA